MEVLLGYVRRLRRKALDAERGSVIDGDQLPREGLWRQELEDDIEDLVGKPQ
jgi:hypothetical protein